jgi:DNA (cytosine-5)-methyltransferase 1
MWREMARIICEVQPRFVFVENSPMLTSRGLGRVLGNLASMGFDARWGVLGAADVGAKHQRDRIWIVGKQRTLAHTLSARQRGNKWQSQNEKNVDGEMAYSKRLGWEKRASECGKFNNEKTSNNTGYSSKTFCNYGSSKWWSVEPNVGRVVDGLASRVDRLKAIGNGQVPLCAATAWRILSESL